MTPVIDVHLEAMTSQPETRGEPGVRRKLIFALVLALGLLTGAGVFALGESEARWMAYALTALFGMLVLLLTKDKDRLLSLVFVLGLQMDVYLRLSYGRAGSTEGIALAFVSIVALMLICVRLFAGKPVPLRNFRLGGLARKPILAILATTALSILTTEEQFIGFAQLTFELQLFLVYWVAYNLVRDQSDFQRMVGLLILILIVQSLVMYVESALGVNFSMVGEVAHRGEVPRPGGTVSSNPAGFSSFITPPLMLAFAYFFAGNTQWRPRAAWLAGLLGLAAIGLTYTRASWAGALLGLVVLAVVLARRGRLRASRVFAVGIVIVVAGLALLPTMSARLTQDYGAHAQSSAWEERWGLMQIAINIVAHHPLTGIGPGSYMYSYKDYIPAGLHQWTSAVHNEFLLRAAETGLPGAIAFIALIAAGFRMGARLVRSDRPELLIAGAGWMAALLSLVWQMSWVPWTGFTYNCMLWFMLGLMDAGCRIACSGPGIEHGIATRVVHRG
jgi:O-antigen ligase